jgi:tetratricopeptide (TPR) repeat protein
MNTIGDRIRSLREFRDLTQEQLADRAGVHVDTIQKARAEPAAVRPHQHPPRARTRPRRPARAPGRTTHRDPATLRPGGGLIELRDAIQDVERPTRRPRRRQPRGPPAPRRLVPHGRRGNRLVLDRRILDLSSRLPLLLRDGRAVARQSSSEPVWQSLALTYQLAACLATQAGHPDWAFAAVEKQLDAAQRASDPLAEGMGVSTLSWVLLRQGRWEEAQAVAARKADALEPPFRRPTAEHLAVYGNLLIAAATPAARRDEWDVALEMLSAAEDAAERSGALRAYGSAFSRGGCADAEGQHCAGGERTAPGEGARVRRRGERGRHFPAGALSAYRVDVAQAQYQTGDSEGALATLLEVEEDQPEWIRFQTLARRRCGRCSRRSAAATRHCGHWPRGWGRARCVGGRTTRPRWGRIDGATGGLRHWAVTDTLS